MRTSHAGACAALLVASCLGTDGPQSPRPAAVEPASGIASQSVRVVIRGEGFLARPSEQQSGGGAELDARHRAWLGDVELGEVTWRDTRTLEATVPAGLPLGPKRLVVENAYGRRGALEEAFVVVASPTAALEATLVAAPATVNVGQPATATFTVRNAGGSTARDVVPQPLVVGGAAAVGAGVEGPSPASAARLDPGATATFTWTVTAAAPGALSLAAQATAVDDLTSATLSSAVAEAAATVQAPALLTATLAAGRGTANVGQAVPVVLTLSNGGAARADITAVTPGAAGPAASCDAVTPALPQSVDPGATLELTWSCTASAAGALSLGAEVGGVDGTSGADLAVPQMEPAVVAVQTPAALSAAVAVGGAPTLVHIGAPLAVTVTVSDTGQAGASVTRVDPVVTPPAAATCGAASPSPPRPVAGLGAVTFGWSCTALVAGNFTLGATVAGSDANTGEALEIAAAGVALRAEIPAVLTSTIAASRSAVNVGQAVTTTFTLINGGTATANITAVTPAASGTATASCGAASPATASIPGGASRAFTWTCTATAPGTLVVTATATGTDGASGGALSVTPEAPASVTVQNPAALVGSFLPVPPAVAVTGQAVDVTLVLENQGESAADLSGIAPSMTGGAGAGCTAAAPAPPQRIAGGTSLALSWSCTAAAAGTFALGATVSVTDVNTSQPLAVPISPHAISVQAPAALAVASFTRERTTANTGQAVGVTLVLSNGGGTAASLNAVTTTISPAAAPGCTAAAPAPPLTLPAGGTVTFTWTCTASAADGYALGATAAGVDAVTGAPLSATAGPAPLAVQAPATLAASVGVAAGDPLVVGQPATVTLTVSNGGGATATVSAVTPSVTGAASATCGAPSPAPPRTLAGGASQVFTWTCTPTAAGSLVLSASVSGTDVNTGTPIEASAGPGVTRTVVPAAALVVTSFTAARDTANTGQAVLVTLALANGGGTAATVTAVAPSIAPATTPGCTAAAPAGAQGVPAGGGSVTFTWTCTASSARAYTLGAVISAEDAVTGAALSPSVTPLALTVQNPAALRASLAVTPGNPLVVGQPASVTLTVTNDGDATANLGSVQPTATGSAAGDCTSASPAPPPAVASGDHVAFTWTCTPAAAGSMLLGASVSGTDANTGAPLTEIVDPGVTRTVVAGAGLAVTSFTANRSTANTGQAVAVTLVVTNGGGTEAIVNAVVPSIAPSASGGCSAPDPSTPRNVPAGDSRTFTWACTGTVPGSYTLGATVAAVDAVTSAPLAATGGPIPLTVQSPASLIASIAVGGPDPSLVDQPVSVTLTVSNLGGASVNLTEVKPSSSGDTAATCTQASPAVPRTLEGAGSATFVWTCTPTRVGSLTLGASVKGTDANTNAALEASPAPVARTVISGTALAVTSFTAGGSSPSVGVPVTVSLAISNTGQNPGTITSLATDMLPSGTSSCTHASPAPAYTVPADGSVTFEWTCTASAPGSYTLVVTIGARDAGDDPVPLAATPIPVTVLAPGDLAPATVQASPGVADVGQEIGVSLALGNEGGATAHVTSVAPAASGAGASCGLPSPNPSEGSPQAIAPGATVTFTWTCTGGTPGTANLSAAVSAVDAGSGANASPTITGVAVLVQAPAALVATLTPPPASVAVDTPAAVALVLRNTGGATARVTAVAPAIGPSGACSAAAPATRDIAGGESFRFDWTCTASSAGTYNLGATVTAGDVNTGAAVPVTVAAVALDVTAAEPAPASAPGSLEVALIATDPLGDGTAEPLLGEVNGAVWVGPALDGRTVAWLDPEGAQVPVLGTLEPAADVSLVAAADPDGGVLLAGATSSSGSIVAPGTDATAAAITALFAVDGVVYAADAGGMARSESAPDGTSAWVDVTPADPAWWARASVAVEPATASAPWPARDRAVPSILAFGRCGEGPCLLAARNVVGVPGQEPPVAAQLWRCEPSAGPAACLAGDWSLAAPDLDGPLTRLGEPTSEALTVLAATQRWLYVGLDGPAGVRLFRGAAAPRAAGELLGRAGCAAGSPGCEGLGGDGFGARGVTRFLDAKVLTAGGVTSLWIVASDGVGPARVYRVRD